MKQAILLLIYLFPTAVICQELKTEEDYSKYIQTLVGGKREVMVEGGRVDLLIEDYAFEIGWASN